MTGRRRGLLILVTIATWSAAVPARELTLEDRVAAQKAIELVFWNHRIWPKENPAPKPPLSAVLSDEAIRARVEDYVKQSNALQSLWHRPIRGDELQAELDRMAKNSRDPQVLRELFEALGDDPHVIAETLVRQALAGRLLRDRLGSGEPLETWWSAHRDELSLDVSTPATAFSLPALGSGGCTVDTWTPTRTDPVQGRTLHTVVWTGSEMIVWGGDLGQNQYTNTGGRYSPSTDTWIPTSIGASVPAARSDHTAVWTGTAMIVWGGYNGAPLGTGARYDPSSDSWTPTSSGPAPRRYHTAVWTGSRMIVWGGEGSGSPVSTGGRYDPAADGWQTTSTGPIGRRFHTAVWTGSEMIVWGGGAGSFYLNSGGRYNPTTDSWMPTSTGTNIPSGRQRHTAVWTGTEVIVWGGHNASLVLKTGGRYLPATNSWLPIESGPDAPHARYGHSAVWTGSEMIVWGAASGGSTNSGGRYSPATDTWQPTSTGTAAPLARGNHTAVWAGTEMIVWGGGGSLGAGFWFNTGGRYNPATDGWVPTSTGPSYVPIPRASFSPVWTGSEMIVWGGAPGLTQTGGRYAPATDTWTPTSTGINVPFPRGGHTAVWTGTEMIVWGGSNFQSSGRRYNPTTDAWLPMSFGPSGRQRHTAMWTGTKMIVWGGETSSGVATSTGGIYTPASDSWTETALPTLQPRTNHTAIWTGTDMIVWGGFRVAGVQTWFNDGGRYDPATNTWTTVSTTNAPVPRELHTAVWTGTRMLVWGGFNGVELNSGGQYNPSTNVWSPTSFGASVPSGRRGHTAVWTGTEMVVWGGNGGASGVLRSDGGRYNPEANFWLPISAGAGAPTARDLHGAVWTGNEMIVWGGFSGGFENSGSRYCVCVDGSDILYRDSDLDGEGNAATPATGCDGIVPPGYSATGADCNDADPNTWSTCATCVDGDADGYFQECDRYLTILGPDCNDSDAAIHPGELEIVDGVDNQCNGMIDELEGTVGFYILGSKSHLAWFEQIGATSYETVRATSPAFSSGCTTFVSEDVFILDTEVPPGGGAFYYLVRPLTPFAGSFGQRSDGAPRTVCP